MIFQAKMWGMRSASGFFCDPFQKTQSWKHSLLVRVSEFLKHLTGLWDKCTRTGEMGQHEKIHGAGHHSTPLCRDGTCNYWGSLHLRPPGLRVEPYRLP